MARPVYSESFFLGTQVGGGTAVTLFAPGPTFVIRDITGYMVADPNTIAGLNINLNGVTIWRQVAAPNLVVDVHWEGRVVVPPGPITMEVTVLGLVTSFANLAISGYSLQP